MKIAAHIKKYLEGELINYPLHKKALAQARQLLYLQHSAGGYADLTGTTPQTDSVSEGKVLHLLTDRHILHLEKSIKAVEDVLAELPAAYSRLVELKYFKACSNQFVADELNISLRTFYHWRGKVLALFAVRYELM